MNYLVISGAVNLITSVVLGLYLMRFTDKAARYLALFCFTVSAWSLTLIMWSSSSGVDSALFWIRFMFIPVPFIVVAYFQFTAHYIRKNRQLLPFIVIGYVYAFIYAALALTPWLITSVDFFSDWNIYVPNPGGIFHPFLAIWWACIISATILLFVYQKNLSKAKRPEVFMMLFGLFIAFISGSVNYLMYYDIMLYPITNGLVTIFVISTVYALVRYRLFNIRISLHQKIIMNTITVFSILVIGAISIGVSMANLPSVIQLVVLVLGMMGVLWLREKLSGQYLLQERYDVSLAPTIELHEMSVAGMKKVLDDVIDVMHEHVGLKVANIYTYNWKDKTYQPWHPEASAVTHALQKDHPILQSINMSEYSVIVKSQLDDEVPVLHAAKTYLQKNTVDVALALTGGGVICAIVFFVYESEDAEEKLADTQTLKKMKHVSEDYGYYIERLLTQSAIFEQAANQN